MPSDIPAYTPTHIAAQPEDERLFELSPEFLAYARSAMIALIGCAVMGFAGASLGGYLDPGLGFEDGGAVSAPVAS